MGACSRGICDADVSALPVDLFQASPTTHTRGARDHANYYRPSRGMPSDHSRKPSNQNATPHPRRRAKCNKITALQTLPRVSRASSMAGRPQPMPWCWVPRRELQFAHSSLPQHPGHEGSVAIHKQRKSFSPSPSRSSSDL